jgi:hypothetical protein
MTSEMCIRLFALVKINSMLLAVSYAMVIWYAWKRWMDLAVSGRTALYNSSSSSRETPLMLKARTPKWNPGFSHTGYPGGYRLLIGRVGVLWRAGEYTELDRRLDMRQESIRDTRSSRPEGSWACGPPKVMKSACYPATALDGSVAFPSVIPRGCYFIDFRKMVRF